jgi:hypothetical protein
MDLEDQHRFQIMGDMNAGAARRRTHGGLPVSIHPNTARGDVAYWKLTPTQAARYHARLARMHANLAAAFARKARRAADLSWIPVAMAAAAVLIAAASLVLG